MVIEKLCLINHLRGELVNDEPQNQKKKEKNLSGLICKKKNYMITKKQQQ